MATNLVGGLGEEIERVTKIRSLYESLRGTPGVNVEFAIAMMNASLKNAQTALNGGEIEPMMAAIEDLRTFTE
jgi:hypothetical protein